MLTPRLSGQFKRDVRKAEKRGKDMAKLRILLGLLLDEKPLPERYRDHPLKKANGLVSAMSISSRIGY